jgi:hypothetical protein
MAKMQPWHPAAKPLTMRESVVGGEDMIGGGDAEQLYHDNDACPIGREFPQERRAPGDGGYQRCPECAALG